MTVFGGTWDAVSAMPGVRFSPPTGVPPVARALEPSNGSGTSESSLTSSGRPSLPFCFQEINWFGPSLVPGLFRTLCHGAWSDAPIARAPEVAQRSSSKWYRCTMRGPSGLH